MASFATHLAAALVLTLGGVLLQGWWQALASVAPAGLDHWLTWLPSLAVRLLLPGASAALALAAAVLLLQHLLLVWMGALGLAWLRRPAQSSAAASSPGNSTSVKPNWLKSRTRIG